MGLTGRLTGREMPRVPVNKFVALLGEVAFGHLTAAQALDRLDQRKAFLNQPVLTPAERATAQRYLNAITGTDAQKNSKLFEIQRVLLAADWPHALADPPVPDPHWPTEAAIEATLNLPA